MSQLNKIVDVAISLSGAQVGVTSFGSALAFALHTLWADDAKEYSSPADMLADGFLITDPAYLAAVDYFSGANPPDTLVVGRRSMTRVITITAVNSYHYIVTIAGTPYEYDADGSATTSEIQAGLIAVINAATSTHHLTASTNSTDKITLTPAAGQCPTIALSLHLAIANLAAADTVANDLARIQLANSDWYGVILCDRDNTDASSVAAWVQSANPRHIFIYSSADSVIIGSGDTTSLAYLWKTAGYTRSAIIYSAIAAARYPDAGIFGVILPKDPGSYTAKFRTLVGITPDALTDGQVTNASGKNANTYVSVANVSMLQEGKVASGEYIDVIVFIDWLEAGLKTDVFSLLVANDKVPFTDAGLQGIGSVIQKKLQDGVTVGGLSDNPAPSVHVPRAKDFTPTQKATRIASGFTFTATLAGAIHFVKLNGNVTP